MDQPVVLSARTLLALLLAAVILSAGIAFAAVTFTQPQSADAQTVKAASEVGELKKANRTLSTISRNLGSFEFSGPSSLRKTTREHVNATKDVERKVEQLCRAVAEFSSSCF